MKVIGTTLETMGFCTDSTCKHYFEDTCLYPTGHTMYQKHQTTAIANDCLMYKKGLHDAYMVDKKKKWGRGYEQYENK